MEEIAEAEERSREKVKKESKQKLATISNDTIVSGGEICGKMTATAQVQCQEQPAEPWDKVSGLNSRKLDSLKLQRVFGFQEARRGL